MEEEKIIKAEATPEQMELAKREAAAAQREAARERAYVARFADRPVQYETVRGVTMPIEPGASRLRREIERKKAKKRMIQDDRSLARLDNAIMQVKAQNLGKTEVPQK